MFHRVKQAARKIDAFRSFAAEIETLSIVGLDAVIINEHNSVSSRFTFDNEAEAVAYVRDGKWQDGCQPEA